MTRDDHRAKCIKAMAIQILRFDGGYGYDQTLSAYDIGSEEWARDFIAYAESNPSCKCGDCPKCQAQETIAKATAAFDSLHGLVRVVGATVTDEMAACASYVGAHEHFRELLAAGDLTKPPEKKP